MTRFSRAQHHRMSPAAGVALVVSVAAGGVPLVTDARRISQVLEFAMERACHFARRGSICLAACDAGADHVLFTVTHAAAVDGASGFQDNDGVRHSKMRADYRLAVGVDSIPEPLRSIVARLLDTDVTTASPGSGKYVLHGRTSILGRGGGAFVPTALPAMPSGWRGRQKAIIALTAALSGHMGVAQDSRRGCTRIWMLLPRAPPAARAVEISLNVVRSPALGPTVATYRAATLRSVALRQDATSLAEPLRTTTTNHTVSQTQTTLGSFDSGGPEPAASAATSTLVSTVISVAAAFSGGTSRLPSSAPALAPLRLAARVTVAPAPRAARRVLLADDEAVLRRLLARMLERLGVAYDALEDGAEVAGALTPEHDLILLDIVMKHSDGVQVRAAAGAALRAAAVQQQLLQLACQCHTRAGHPIRQVCTALRAAGVTIPIFAMTGNVDPASIGIFRSCGFSGLLAKPFVQVRM
jgi:CheY-like chemotaxis protein